MTNNSDNRKVWDKCFSCYKAIEISQKEWDYRQCRKCKTISFLVQSFSVLCIVSLVAFHLWFKGLSSSKYNIYTLGYVFDLIGGWFLASGFADLFAMAAGSWGGGGGTFKKFGWINFKRRNAGLVCLSMGFILQGVANILPE